MDTNSLFSLPTLRFQTDRNQPMESSAFAPIMKQIPYFPPSYVPHAVNASNVRFFMPQFDSTVQNSSGRHNQQNTDVEQCRPNPYIELHISPNAVITNSPWSPQSSSTSSGCSDTLMEQSVEISGVCCTNDSSSKTVQGAAANADRGTPSLLAGFECAVCGDKSSGKHYGQYTCEGCKSFFKRTVRRQIRYTCRNDDACSVDMDHRNQCQSCRFKKCLAAGMRKDAVQRGRLAGSNSVPTPTLRPKSNPFVIITSTPGKISQLNTVSGGEQATKYDDDENISCFIAKLIDADPYCHTLGTILPGIAARQGGLLEAEKIGELSSRLLFSAIGWAKNLAIFNEFDLCDQINLLCSAWSELFLLNMAQCNINLHVASLLAFSGLHCMTPGAGDMVPVLLNHIGLFQDRVHKLQQLKMDVAEFSCLKALILFSPDNNALSNITTVTLLQERAQKALQDYCSRRESEMAEAEQFESCSKSSSLKKGRFGRLLLRLPSLKIIGPLVERIFFARIIGRKPIELIIKELLVSDGSGGSTRF